MDYKNACRTRHGTQKNRQRKLSAPILVDKHRDVDGSKPEQYSCTCAAPPMSFCSCFELAIHYNISRGPSDVSCDFVLDEVPKHYSQGHCTAAHPQGAETHSLARYVRGRLQPFQRCSSSFLFPITHLGGCAQQAPAHAHQQASCPHRQKKAAEEHLQTPNIKRT